MNSSKHLFLVFSQVLFFSTAIAQKDYQGDYKFNNIKGEAAFQFVEGVDGKVIQQGDFSFVRKENDLEDKTRFYRTVITGTYEQGKKNGSWVYVDEDHRLNLKDVVDFALISDLKSSQIKLKANYSNGIADGKWVFEENEFFEGSLKKKAKAEEFLFKNGDLQGEFLFKTFVDDQTLFIEGELMDHGIMNGEWTIVYQNEGRLISEVRKYENGFLLGLVKRDLEKNLVIEEQVFFETISKLNQVNAGSNVGFRIADQSFGILFNDGFLSSSGEIQGQLAGNEFISDFLIKILRYDTDFVDSNSELLDYPLHTKKFVFDLSRSQQKIIEELPHKFDNLVQIATAYKEKNTFKLNRQKSDSLSAAYSFFEFQVDKLQKFNELINKFRSKEIQFYDVQYISSKGLEFVTKIDRITYYTGSDVKRFEVTYQIPDFKIGFYKALDVYISDMYAVTTKYKAFVDRQLSIIDQDSDLKGLEQKIQKRKIQIEKLFSTSIEEDEITEVLLDAVKSNLLKDAFDRVNERYAKSNQFASKKEEANILLDLLDEIEYQHKILSNVSKNWKILDAYYEEEVINPFTYTNYDKRSKPRLFESAEKLFEYYLENIEKEQDYTAIKTWTSKIETLIIKMSSLRNEDTKNLERKLNRRSSIGKIESDLEL